eukprot:CAMPEP_0201479186 /NCGR_PEP_ID=MMETSP0151_2-20130828/3901_1 /ASSEMBLY_ACC=CAM_ASM_000257 /TAXON_ID=200890 /ORGANISM="Paramoeba atlantica, Strain 621/1 / CCAP 1560/9" /LENGTH=735 /DNA_ID=CAMNT_0047860551 /DNA_START=30 /DNA_END=2237 /DNA_ORIENTATION=-
MSKKGKLTTKAFRNQIQMDPNYADNTWRLLKNAIHEIHKQNASGLSYEELYRNAYNMVLHKYGDLLYSGLEEVVDEHLKEVCKTIAVAKTDEEFLEKLDEAWRNHKISMLMIRDILMYMDRVYVLPACRLPVYDLGLELFRNDVAKAPEIRNRLSEIVLEMIRLERTGERIDAMIIKNITQMWVDLGINSRIVYEEDFEREFLRRSADFYNVESQEFLAANSCPDYMRKVEQRLIEEDQRVERYLDPETHLRLRDTLERVLITAQIRTLIEMEGSGLIPMLKEDRIDDLNRMYLLFRRSFEGLDLMGEVMGNYVRDLGKAVVTDKDTGENPQLFVQSLLDLRAKFIRILEYSFQRNKEFLKTLNQAFEYFINLNPRSAEYISLFIDDKLKKGEKRAGDEDIQLVMKQVMDIFRYIGEKDIFERFYKQHLAKRLLLGKSVSDDAEKSMIQQLKIECGYQFTSKLEGMFNDIRISQETMDQFRLWVESTGVALAGVDLHVLVLTTGFWPTQPSAKCLLPPEANHCRAVFCKFYLSQHTGRRLTWQANMGTAELKVYFGGEKHELNVSSYQMLILSQFAQHDTLSYEQLRSATEIPPVDLRRNLLMLALGKHKILLKEPRTKKVEDDAQFSFNHNFRSKFYRIKVLQTIVTKNDAQANHGATLQKIGEDRKHQIEAAIVRVMKARKRMDHSNLIAEVTKQLSSRYHPDPQDIKRRIECLIEREYLERSADRKRYEYLA